MWGQPAVVHAGSHWIGLVGPEGQLQLSPWWSHGWPGHAVDRGVMRVREDKRYRANREDRGTQEDQRRERRLGSQGRLNKQVRLGSQGRLGRLGSQGTKGEIRKLWAMRETRYL